MPGDEAMPFVERDGVRLYFSDSGDGPAVLLHTGGAGDGRMWEPAGYARLFAGRRQLILDHRGHGRSDHPTGTAAHRLDEYVADVIAVLDAAGVERAALVGYSAGARVALAVAARHPERSAAVIAIGSVPLAAGVPGGNLEVAALVRRIGTRALIERMAAGESEPVPPWLLDNLSETPAEMFAVRIEAWSDAVPAWDELPAVRAPTLLVCGAAEASESEAGRAAARLVDGRAVVLPGLGHLQVFWRVEVTGPVITRFLSDRVP